MNDNQQYKLGDKVFYVNDVYPPIAYIVIGFQFDFWDGELVALMDNQGNIFYEQVNSKKIYAFKT